MSTFRTAAEIGRTATGPRALPTIGEQRSATGLSSVDTVLDNGLRVVAVHQPTVPMVELRLRIPFAGEDPRHAAVAEVLAATILTEDDWKKFRQLFEKVYPGFFIHLKESIPDLSATDTRLLALTKLKLPSKDMASMLGVSYDAVKKAKQRLRKKINLPDEEDLEDLVKLI